MRDMGDEREAAAAAVRSVGAQPVMFETFGGRDADPEAAYLAEVRASDIYLGILARAYGKLLATRRSATHEEYREAEKAALRISVWTAAAEEWMGDQSQFVDEVRLFHVTGRYSSPEQLHDGVLDRLRRMAAEELTPWVKIGASFDAGVLFRAREITDDGQRLKVVAEVKDHEVAAALEAMRGGLMATWHGRLTWAANSTQVKARKVTSTWSTSRTAAVTLELEREDLPVGEPWGQMAYRVANTTYSSDDVTELALRHVVLNEPHPFDSMRFLSKVEDPIAILRDLRLDEEALRPVAALLFTEALVGSGRAARVTKVRLGVPIAGCRSIEVAWQPPGRLSSKPEWREISGSIEL